jgi:hypothetical protein
MKPGTFSTNTGASAARIRWNRDRESFLQSVQEERTNKQINVEASYAPGLSQFARLFAETTFNFYLLQAAGMISRG